MAQSTVKYKDTLHSEMLLEIIDELEEKNFEDVKDLCRGPLKNRELADITNVRDLIRQLERRGVVKKGNYQNIIVMFTTARLPEVVDIIQEFKKKIDEAPERDSRGTKRCVSPLTHVPGTPMSPPVEFFENSSNNQKTDVVTNNCYDRKIGKGLVLIINNKHFGSLDCDRDGSEKDVKNLEELFSTDCISGYEVVIHCDLTLDDFNKRLEETQQKLKSRNYDQFLCFIMSHGKEGGILTKDNEHITVETIVQKFKSNEVKELAGLPKAFFVQACRGGTRQPCETVTDHEGKVKKRDYQFVDMPDMRITIPVDADVLIGYSTTKGYVSFRNVHSGSWYIYNIYRVFKQLYTEEHIVDMLTRVHEEVSAKEGMSGEKQMPNFDSTLRKKMYLSQKK